jgi:hypothetical protein
MHRKVYNNNGIPLFEMRKSYLPLHKNLAEGHCLVGSLTGEVASKIVTEAYKGWLIPDGNRDSSCKRIKPA